jgi:hypothetical protein
MRRGEDVLHRKGKGMDVNEGVLCTRLAVKSYSRDVAVELDLKSR